MWRSRQATQDRIQSLARHLWLDAAQHVVGAEFENDGVGAFRHRPIEPRQAAGRGIAGDTGIGDLDSHVSAGKRGLEPGYEALPFGQAETRRQRVAERHDPHRRGRIRNRNGGSGSQCNATNSGMQDLAQTCRAPI